MDEPATGLDVKSTESFIGLIEQEKQRGAIVIIVTHETKFAAAVADRLLRIHWATAGDDAIAGIKQFFAGGKRFPVKAPIRVPAQFLPSLIRFVDGQKERSWIGRMDQHRQSQPSTGRPNGVPPLVVDSN